MRFLASHLRLFHTQQPWRELPLAIGFPRNCYAMSCARMHSGHFTAAGLQQFAAAALLRLPRLPPISGWLIGSWCRAVPDGQIGVVALLRDGVAQPLPLLDAVARARGQVQAATAVWR